VIAEELCRAASIRTGVPVLPALWSGSSDAHTDKWPGTFSLGPLLLVDVVVALARLVSSCGFGRLLIVNAHVGNVGPLAVAVDETVRRELRAPESSAGLRSPTRSLAA
jgi:creatinine amidohydrolase